MSVYLDYNATTPVAPEVLETISSALRDAWANPSSNHVTGRLARACIEKARGQVAKMINSLDEEIVFTSGGTESNNMVFDSVMRYWGDGGCVVNEGKPHIIISNLEHMSVAKCASQLEREQRADVTVVAADMTMGAVRVEDIMAAIRPSTILISLMLAQNETGVLQVVGEVVRAVKEHERSTERKRRIYIHTDAAQALGKVGVDVQTLGVDYLTVAGHKFYGPRIGALYCRGLGEHLRSSSGQGAPLYPLLCGGCQERGLRPGTENTGLIAGLGKACQLVSEHLSDYTTHTRTVRDYLEQRLQETFGTVCFNGCYDGSERLPNTCNFSLTDERLTGQRILGALECSLVGVGAACHSHNTRASAILLASGVEEKVAVNALRVSVGRTTSSSDIDSFIEDLVRARDSIINSH